jgi:hypothetical protein
VNDCACDGVGRIDACLEAWELLGNDTRHRLVIDRCRLKGWTGEGEEYDPAREG